MKNHSKNKRKEAKCQAAANDWVIEHVQHQKRFGLEWTGLELQPLNLS
jgi:hypothetical protein